MTATIIKVGQVGFGTVNGIGPTNWRLLGKAASQVGVDGRVGGGWRLEHVCHPAQSVAYQDQYVSWDVVERIMG